MEMVLEVILRVLLIGYYLMMAVFVIRQIRIRFLADEQYALYANYESKALWVSGELL